MSDIRYITAGLRFPEGPIAMLDGSVIVVEIAAGRLSRVDQAGKISVIAELGGGPNGAVLGPDGWCYVCNNGGFCLLGAKEGLSPAGPAAACRRGRTEKLNRGTGENGSRS